MVQNLLILILIMFSAATPVSAQQKTSSLPISPTGPHIVGTVVLPITDRDRIEAWTENPDDPRSFSAQVWYPAKADSKGEEPLYYPDFDVMLPELEAIWGGFVPEGFEFYKGLRTNALLNVEPEGGNGSSPLIIFSHGMRAFSRADYTALYQELASHGYVVVAIDHPFDGIASVLPSGQIATHNGVRWIELQTSETLLKREFPLAFRSAVRTWAADQLTAVRLLRRIAKRGNVDRPISLVAKLVDFSRIGAAGHSLGGIAAATSCRLYTVFKACLNMHGGSLEPWPFLGAEYTVIVTPFMYLSPPGALDQTKEIGFESGEDFLASKWARYYLASLDGATHVTFSDKPLFHGNPRLAGDFDPPYRGWQVAIETARAFFDVWLKGAPKATLESLAAAYPELSITSNLAE